MKAWKCQSYVKKSFTLFPSSHSKEPGNAHVSVTILGQKLVCVTNTMVDASAKLWWLEGSVKVVRLLHLGSVVLAASVVTVIILALKMSSVTRRQGSVDVTPNNQHSGASVTSASQAIGTSPFVSSASVMVMLTPAIHRQGTVSTAGTIPLEIFVRSVRLDSMVALSLGTTKSLVESVAVQTLGPAVTLMQRLVILTR